MSFYIEKASQQLTGFFHAKAGYDLASLIEAMGLTQEEWEDDIKPDSSFLTQSQINEIDQYFNS